MRPNRCLKKLKKSVPLKNAAYVGKDEGGLTFNAKTAKK